MVYKLAKEKKSTSKKKDAEETVVEKTAEEVVEETVEEVSDEKDAIIEELNNKLLEANDKLLRTVAEYDNFRKRSAKEKDALYSDSKADVAKKILPVIDNFERAAAADSDLETYKKGIEMTVKQLLDAFLSVGIEAFGERGEEFDPNYHNCVMHVDDESLGENVISEVYMKGYKMGEKVIRPATVIVAN